MIFSPNTLKADYGPEDFGCFMLLYSSVELGLATASNRKVANECVWYSHVQLRVAVAFSAFRFSFTTTIVFKRCGRRTLGCRFCRRMIFCDEKRFFQNFQVISSTTAVEETTTTIVATTTITIAATTTTIEAEVTTTRTTITTTGAENQLLKVASRSLFVIQGDTKKRSSPKIE